VTAIVRVIVRRYATFGVSSDDTRSLILTSQSRQEITPISYTINKEQKVVSSNSLNMLTPLIEWMHLNRIGLKNLLIPVHSIENRDAFAYVTLE